MPADLEIHDPNIQKLFLITSSPFRPPGLVNGEDEREINTQEYFEPHERKISDELGTENDVSEFV